MVSIDNHQFDYPFFLLAVILPLVVFHFGGLRPILSTQGFFITTELCYFLIVTTPLIWLKYRFLFYLEHFWLHPSYPRLGFCKNMVDHVGQKQLVHLLIPKRVPISRQPLKIKFQRIGCDGCN
jgi:hypothetical protein